MNQRRRSRKTGAPIGVLLAPSMLNALLALPAISQSEPPPLDLPDVVVSGVDQPVRPTTERDPAKTALPSLPRGVVLGPKSSSEGSPEPLPLSADSVEPAHSWMHAGGLVGLGNLGRYDLGAAIRGRLEAAAYQLRARWYDEDRYQGALVRARLRLDSGWSAAGKVDHRQRDLWGLPATQTLSDERSHAEIELRKRANLSAQWYLNSRVRMGGAAIGKSEGPQGQRSGSCFALNEGVGRDAGDLHVLAGVGIAADPYTTSGRLTLQGVRGSENRVLYRARLETVAAHFAGQTEWRLLGGGGLVVFLPTNLMLSLDLFADSEVRSLEWWSRLSPPVRADQLQPAIMTRRPHAEVALADPNEHRIALSFERRDGDWAWVESTIAPGLWEPLEVDTDLLRLTLAGPLTPHGDAGLWIEHAQRRGGEEIPYRAPWTWRIHSSWELGRSRWSAALQGSNDAVTQDGGRRLGWATLDCASRFALPRGFELGVEVVNLLDEEWAVWRNYDEAGRTLRVNLRWGWEETDDRLPRGASWYREDDR